MAAEVHYVFSKYQTLKPYAGGGLGLIYINYDDDHPGDGSDTEASLSAITGGDGSFEIQFTGIYSNASFATLLTALSGNS